MNTDLMLVIGLLLGVLALPTLLSAAVERRSPRLGALLILGAAGFLYFALTGRPGGYRIAEIPDVVIRVLGRLLN